jgi:hypothetical protein
VCVIAAVAFLIVAQIVVVGYYEIYFSVFLIYLGLAVVLLVLNAAVSRKSMS